MRRFKQEVSAGSMADIAFLLLIFFLVTTTIMQDRGIITRLPPMPENEDETVQYNDELVLNILINNEDELLVESQALAINQMKRSTIDFLLNNIDQDAAPVISLSCRRGTSYARYIDVYDQLRQAYSHVWNSLAMQHYQKSYLQLAAHKQKTIRTKLPLVISEAEVN